ncbi:binding domain of DNA repair protein Ercc1-domain-containing protein [Lactarius pseudohatsudake]|nr:binding domain of DNA repair protein Ercc1-domain-containing protein [Lactarius pseudohatsudake]
MLGQLVPRQRLNPVIECIRNVPNYFGDIPPDYQVGATTGILFLSQRYHRHHPDYIHRQRTERLGRAYKLHLLHFVFDVVSFES